MHTDSAAAGGTLGHYIIYFELEAAAAGDASAAVAAACAAALEAALDAQQSCYTMARGEGKLAPLELRLVAPAAFAAVRDLALAAGTSAMQYKSPVVLVKAEQVAALDARVLAAASAGC